MLHPQGSHRAPGAAWHPRAPQHAQSPCQPLHSACSPRPPRRLHPVGTPRAEPRQLPSRSAGPPHPTSDGPRPRIPTSPPDPPFHGTLSGVPQPAPSVLLPTAESLSCPGSAEHAPPAWSAPAPVTSSGRGRSPRSMPGLPSAPPTARRRQRPRSAGWPPPSSNSPMGSATRRAAGGAGERGEPRLARGGRRGSNNACPPPNQSAPSWAGGALAAAGTPPAAGRARRRGGPQGLRWPRGRGLPRSRGGDLARTVTRGEQRRRPGSLRFPISPSRTPLFPAKRKSQTQ